VTLSATRFPRRSRATRTMTTTTNCWVGMV
jgi:hypothetical protein